MKVRGLNDNKVTTDLSLSIGTIGKSRRNHRDLSRKVVQEILSFYSDIEETWLSTGKGDMLKATPEYQIQKDELRENINDPAVKCLECKDRDTTINKLNNYIDNLENQLKEMGGKTTLPRPHHAPLSDTA